MLQTVAADVTLTDSEADAATITTADVVSAITAACGSSFSYAAVADTATTTDVAVAMTAACGSSVSYAAAVVSATADVETDAADSGWSLSSISFFLYISTLFLIYIYNVKGRNCHGKENTQIIAAVR